MAMSSTNAPVALTELDVCFSSMSIIALSFDFSHEPMRSTIQ